MEYDIISYLIFLIKLSYDILLSYGACQQRFYNYMPIIAFRSSHTGWAIFPFDGEMMKQRHRLVLWEEWILADDE